MPRFDKSKPIRVVVVGGGISGIATGIRLRQELGDKVALTIIEKKASPGGTWRDSTWPGCSVDVPIHLYQLFSDLKPDWTELFASQPEVLAYWLGLVKKYELTDAFLFNSEFLGSSWSEATQSHTILVASNNGNKLKLEAEVLVSAAGPLAKPRIPAFPGVESFAGTYFHNLEWEESVRTQNISFEGKRIAVVGNGSSGVQFIPGLSELPGTSVTQYIRSGGYFIPKEQYAYTPFDKWLYRWVPFAERISRLYYLYLHDVEWSIDTLGKTTQAKRDRQTKRLLAYLKEKAPEEYYELLKPKYPLGVKRIALDYGWLDTLHKPNVELVGTPIASVRPEGIETSDGKVREHDIIIYATGSDVSHTGLGLSQGVYGENGVELRAFWDKLGGPQAYGAGIAVPGFPNYFIVIGPNAISGSWGFTLGVNSAAIGRIVREIVDYGLSSLQPTVDAFKAHNASVQAQLATSAPASQLTANWWRTDDGHVTVPNPDVGLQLAWHQSWTKWADWKAVRAVERSGKTRLQRVDVAAKRRNTRLLQTAVTGAVLGAAWYNWPALVRLAKEDAGYLRQFVGL